jgi:hypothetical protein
MSEKLYDTPKRHGGEHRGNSKDRAARRNWISSSKAGFGGNGTTVPCVHCGSDVEKPAVHIDRKEPGGSYRHENIQPACAGCNQSRSNNPDWVGPLGKQFGGTG